MNGNRVSRNGNRAPKCKGEFVSGLVDAIVEISPTFEERILDILAENGIEDPSINKMYAADDVISSINQLADDIGPKTTSRIAVHQITVPDWPDEIDTVEQSLDALDDMYRAAYVNFDKNHLGEFKFEQTSDREGRGAVTDAFPYPRTFAEGTFKGSLAKFTAEDSLPTVSETEPGAREKAAFELRW